MLHSYITAVSTIEDNAENGNRQLYACPTFHAAGTTVFYTACFIPLRKQSIRRDIIPCATIWYYQTWLDRLMILNCIYETSLQRCRVFRIM